jgi:hypothetical protein
VSTEELGKAFVDKGNWPVLTTFGLLYDGYAWNVELKKDTR